MYQLIFGLIIILFANLASANSNVWLTNNTISTLYINSDLITSDQNFLTKKGVSWYLAKDKLNPFETKQIAWFSRNKDLKANMLYRYIICLTPLESNEKCTIDTRNAILYQFDVIAYKSMVQLCELFYNNRIQINLKYSYKTD